MKFHVWGLKYEPRFLVRLKGTLFWGMIFNGTVYYNLGAQSHETSRLGINGSLCVSSNIL